MKIPSILEKFNVKPRKNASCLCFQLTRNVRYLHKKNRYPTRTRVCNLEIQRSCGKEGNTRFGKEGHLRFVSVAFGLHGECTWVSCFHFLKGAVTQCFSAISDIAGLKPWLSTIAHTRNEPRSSRERYQVKYWRKGELQFILGYFFKLKWQNLKNSTWTFQV